MMNPYQPDAVCLTQNDPSVLQAMAAFIEDERSDERYYRALAQKAPTDLARSALTEIAEDEARHAKNLMACYYLICGKHYMTDPHPANFHMPFYPNALRKKFQDEMNGASNYTVAASDLTDACLADQYRRHAEEENEHANILRGLLAQMM